MSEASRHLRSVPLPSTGEVPEDGPQTLSEALEIIALQNRKLNGAWSQISKLQNENARLQALEPEADDILDILTHWRRWCMPGATITVGDVRWMGVRSLLRLKDAETDKPAYTPLSLKAAAIGVKLSEWHVQNKQLDIFKAKKGESLTAKIDAHIARAIGFKRIHGVSALELVDELAGESLKWLAERCSCGHFRLDHVRQGPTPDGRQPCDGEIPHEETGMPVPCPCQDFDWLSAKWNQEGGSA